MDVNLAVNSHTVGLRIDLPGLTERGIFSVTQVARLDTQQVGQAVPGDSDHNQYNSKHCRIHQNTSLCLCKGKVFYD